MIFLCLLTHTRAPVQVMVLQDQTTLQAMKKMLRTSVIPCAGLGGSTAAEGDPPIIGARESASGSPANPPPRTDPMPDAEPGAELSVPDSVPSSSSSSVDAPQTDPSGAGTAAADIRSDVSPPGSGASTDSVLPSPPTAPHRPTTRLQ